jgi:hypothetical protein
MVLIETDGSARSMPGPNVTAATLQSVMESHIDSSARIVTDEMRSYPKARALRLAANLRFEAVRGTQSRPYLHKLRILTRSCC